ncbi:MAG: histidinol-phosphatase [Burkholderiales bacterium]|nr:histidinol-phosphatase [Burkholderiales bacterium]
MDDGAAHRRVERRRPCARGVDRRGGAHRTQGHPLDRLAAVDPGLLCRRGGLHADRLHEGRARGPAHAAARAHHRRHRGLARAARQRGRVEGRDERRRRTRNSRRTQALTPREASAYLAFARATAERAGAAILPHFRAELEVEDKRNFMGYDPVTVADRAAEQVIRDAIKEAYPDHGIHGEEHGRAPGTSAYTWVIDPIDGTKSFILGQLHWGVLIALHDGAAPVLGVAYQPFVGEMFEGVAGACAHWRRGEWSRRLRTRSCAAIGDAIVATTDPRQFQTAAEQAALAVVSRDARLLRYGGDCYCYTQLAMGLVDVVIENGLQAYDIQALIPIIQAAGGVVTDWSGGRCDEGGRVVACGDPALHALLLKLLQKAA